MTSAAGTGVRSLECPPRSSVRTAVLGHPRLDSDAGAAHDPLRREHRLCERRRPGRACSSILDAGSGLRPLGHELMSRGNNPVAGGYPPFAHPLGPHSGTAILQAAECRREIGSASTGAAQEGVALEEILRRQMDPMVFPVPLDGARREIRGPGDRGGRRLALADFHVSAFRLRHPGTTLGFRLGPVDGGRDLAYVTDNELGTGGTYPVSAGLAGAAGRNFSAGTDTLIHDAMYSDQIIRLAGGWGHSTPRQAVDLAAEAGWAPVAPVSPRARARRCHARSPRWPMPATTRGGWPRGWWWKRRRRERRFRCREEAQMTQRTESRGRSALVAMAVALARRSQAQDATGYRRAPVRERRLLRPGQGDLRGAGAGHSGILIAATLAAHPGARVVDPRPRSGRPSKPQKLGPAQRVDAATAAPGREGGRCALRVTGSFADFYGKFRINARLVDARDAARS